LGEKLILAVIYLGNDLPKYVLKNLDYLRKTFPEDETYFISDSNLSLKKAARIGVKTWLAPNPDEQWKDVRKRLTHPMGFRKGFWFRTLARFFVLNSFMQLHRDECCLQIEADVFLFPNFPIARFRILEAEIAFPMESSEMGIASLLYLRDHKAAETLVEFAMRVIQLNSEVTDMSLLGQIAHSTVMKFVPLRTLPIGLKGALNQSEALNLISKNTLEVPGVFDGITVGQYLLGIDPRNSRGSLILHQRQHSHAINPEKLDFVLDGEMNLWLIDPSENWPVYNLHNHAKDLRLYQATSRNKLLTKRIASSKQGEKREFIPRIFIDAGYKAIERRAIHARKGKRQ
jgi:hypothetical protein